MIKKVKAHKLIILLLFLIFMVSILTVEASTDRTPIFVQSSLVLAVHSFAEAISVTHSFMQYIYFNYDEHVIKNIFLLNLYDRAPPRL